MTTLFITEINPFPVFGGERIRSYGILRLLSRINSKVIAIIGKGKEEINNNDFNNVVFIEYDFNSNKKSSYFNHFDKFRKDKDLLKLLENQLNNYNVDIAFIDYQFKGQYISFLQSRGIPTIYGTHNVQSRIILQKPADSLKEKAANMFVYVINWLHEKIYFRRADAIIAVSENDHKYYGKFIRHDKIFIIPNFLVEKDYSSLKYIKQDFVIFAANFYAFQNFTGLKWFLENVWNKSEFTNYKLVLAGMGSDKASDVLVVLKGIRNVEAIGPVDDMKPYIAQAKISIVPLLHGSGTRLKCIEAMALKTQIISTSKGAEGIDHEGSIIIADTAEDFSHKLLELLETKMDLTQQAYEIFIKNYSSESNIQTLYAIYNKLCKAE